MLPPLQPTELQFPNETTRDLPSSLRARLSDRSSQEDIASTSARASERSRQLREQHIAHRIERAARETQRGEEAAARKRRRENLCAAIQSYGEEHSLSSRESVTESIASGGKPVVQELAVASKLKRETDQARVEALANENHPLAGAAVRKVLMETEASPARNVLEEHRQRASSMSPRRSMQDTEQTNPSVCSTPRPVEREPERQVLEWASIPTGAGLVAPSGAANLIPADTPLPSKASPRRSLEISSAASATTPAARLDLSTQQQQQQFSTHAFTPRMSPRRQPEMPTIVEEEDEDYDSPERPQTNARRAFERDVYKVPVNEHSRFHVEGSSASRMMTCYEIRWADGSFRRIYGL